jgi:transcriptional regulator with XRE-family HTH domain
MTPLELITDIRASGLTQTQVAERCGVRQPTISKIERGEVQDVMSRSYLALQALHSEIAAQKTTPRKKKVA